MPAGAIGSRTRTRVGRQATVGSNASSARDTAAPRSIVRAELDEPQLDGGQRRHDVEDVEQPMWPMRKISRFNGPWPPASCTPVTVAQQRHELGGVDACGRMPAVTTARASRRPARRARAPSPSSPRAHARPRRTCRSNAASRPSSSRRPSATSRPARARPAGVNGGVELVLRLARPLPVEVEARRGRAARRGSRRHRRRPRRRDPAASSTPSASRSTTTSMPQESISSGTAPRLETASTTTCAPDCLRRGGKCWMSATTPVEVSECARNTRAVAVRLREQPGCEDRRPSGNSPMRSGGGTTSQRRTKLGDRHPALAEGVRPRRRPPRSPASRGSRPPTRSHPCPRR